MSLVVCVCDFFFKDPATTEIYTYGHTLALHDALPIYHASFCGLGRNDGSNLALTYERRAMCARGGIGEDQRHVFGPHIAAIGAISAASADRKSTRLNSSH